MYRLVELIVLNVGLQAGILDARTFSMFVVHALVLTFMTTPLTLLWYPPKYHTRATVVGDALNGLPTLRMDSSDEAPKTNFSVVLNKVDHLPAVMTLTQLLQSPAPSRREPSLASGSEPNEKDKMALVSAVTPASITINALRLIELTERTSAVMKSQEADTLVHRDSIISVFRTFGRLNRIPVSAALSVVNQDEFSMRVANHARETGAQMVIIPWSSGAHAPSAALDDQAVTYNPFDGMFSNMNKASSIVYSQFVRKVFAESPSDVALFVDRGHAAGPDKGYGHHIFLPFFGGPDDRLALRFVVQLCSNPLISATVVRLNKTDGNNLAAVDSIDAAKAALANSAVNQPTMHSVSVCAVLHMRMRTYS